MPYALSMASRVYRQGSKQGDVPHPAWVASRPVEAGEQAIEFPQKHLLLTSSP
jgi:hypothetical protein